MTVTQLRRALADMPPDAVVMIDQGAGLSGVSALELTPGTGPGAPAEVLLLPNLEE